MENLSILVEQSAGTIKFNNEELKSALAEQMEVYRSLEVTEDVLLERKADLATLRKMRTSIEDRRKDVKKAFMAPYEEFEAKAKELVRLIDEPIELIDAQVKAYAEKKRIEKENLCREIFAELTSEYAEYVNYDKVYNPKWANVSTTEKSIREDITGYVDEIAMAVNAVKNMDSEFEQDGLDRLKSTGSLSAAIDTIRSKERMRDEIIARQKAEEERRRQEEEQRKQREEAQRQAEQERVEEERKSVSADLAEDPAGKPTEEPQEEIAMSTDKTAVFTVCAADYMLDYVEVTLKELGVAFKREDRQ